MINGESNFSCPKGAKMKKIQALILTIIILFVMINVSKMYAKDAEEVCGFSLFGKWFEWKSSTNISQKQREVIDYLKNASAIRDKAFNTIFVTPKSRYGYADIKEAIKITKQSFVDLKHLPVPHECRAYKKRCIEDLKYVLKYHELRLQYGDGTEEFNKRRNALELAYSEANSKSDILSEFYNCLNKIGLMSNIEQELADLESKERK